MGEATHAAATDNPAVQFFGVDQAVPNPCPPNYQNLRFDEAEAGYLAGIVAGSTTATGTIGTIGGMGVPPVLAYINVPERGGIGRS